MLTRGHLRTIKLCYKQMHISNLFSKLFLLDSQIHKINPCKKVAGAERDDEDGQTDRHWDRQHSLFSDQQHHRTQRPQREVAGAERDDEVVDGRAALLHRHDDELVVPSLVSGILESAVLTVLGQ